MDKASQFAFDLGKVMGAFSTGEVKKYLLENGITEDDLKRFDDAAIVIAGAFYFDRDKDSRKK